MAERETEQFFGTEYAVIARAAGGAILAHPNGPGFLRNGTLTAISYIGYKDETEGGLGEREQHEVWNAYVKATWPMVRDELVQEAQP